MSIDFRFKRGDPSFGRLCVGIRVRNWTKVYYEPIPAFSANNDSQLDEPGSRNSSNRSHAHVRAKNKTQKPKSQAPNEPDIALFHFDDAFGPLEAREPMEGEVLWLPHFDPHQFEARTMREKKRLQKRFLGDCWRVCVARTEEELQSLEEELKDDRYMRWVSWMEMARKWKRDRWRRQARGVAAKNGDVEEEDEFYSSPDEDGTRKGRGRMEPPPRPRRGGGAKRRRDTDGVGDSQQGKEKKTRTAGPDSTNGHLSSRFSTEAQPSMSGDLGISGASGRSHGADMHFANDDGSEDEKEDDDESLIFIPDHPEQEDNDNEQPGRLNENHMLTPDLTVTQQSTSSNNGLRPFSEWVNGANTATTQNGHHNNHEHGGEEILQSGNLNDTFSQPGSNNNDLNGGLNEDEAVQRATQASLAPECQSRYDREMQHAVRASLAPEREVETGVVAEERDSGAAIQSIEDEGEGRGDDERDNKRGDERDDEGENEDLGANSEEE